MGFLHYSSYKEYQKCFPFVNNLYIISALSATLLAILRDVLVLYKGRGYQESKSDVHYQQDKMCPWWLPTVEVLLLLGSFHEIVIGI